LAQTGAFSETLNPGAVCLSAQRKFPIFKVGSVRMFHLLKELPVLFKNLIIDLNINQKMFIMKEMALASNACITSNKLVCLKASSHSSSFPLSFPETELFIQPLN